MEKEIIASSNIRLAKNTIFLYVRTLLVMAISLYTSRVILAALGVDDYGIYNIIGGFVSMFSLLGGTLVSATQRFITFEMGKQENADVNKVFNTSMGIHIGLSVFLVVVFESFGLWFLNVKLNIPEERMLAANCAYQCSILAFLINILSLPYNAIIVAHEKMRAFAYIGLLDAVIKLLISISLYYWRFDLLIVYSVLILLDSALIRLIYGVYCKKFFVSETKIRLHKDIQAYKSQMSFAGYTFIGSSASILSNQGVNIIMNLFCGVVVNAARGIADQVQSATEKFANDFMTALNPQITKTFAAGNKEDSIKLVYRGARFSFYLMLLISLPLIFRTDRILEMWLTKYPNYAVDFVRFSLFYSMISVLSKPVITEILATGTIKVNALAIGGFRLLILPLCYMGLYLGYEPTICYIIVIVIDFFALNIRLIIVKTLVAIPVYRYYKEVILYIIPVFMISFCFIYVFNSLFPTNWWGCVFFCISSIIVSGFVCLLIGLSNVERQLIKSLVQKAIHCI